MCVAAAGSWVLISLRQQRIKIPWEHTPGGGEQSSFRMSHRAQALNLEGAEGGSLPQGSTIEMPTDPRLQGLRTGGSGWQQSPWNTPWKQRLLDVDSEPRKSTI